MTDISGTLSGKVRVGFGENIRGWTGWRTGNAYVQIRKPATWFIIAQLHFSRFP